MTMLGRALSWSMVAAILPLVAADVAAQEEPAFTDVFPLEECRFSDTGRNAYFSLVPGDQLVLEGEDDGETVLLHVTVLKDRQWITFRTEDGIRLPVRTRVVEEREWVDGELVEVSRNFFARCKQTGDIYYFGEDVDIYEDGVIDSHDGAWRAGFDDALPGLIMPGTYLLGARYFQEIAPGVALDRAEHVAMDLELDLPAGDFDDCVEIVETSPLEPGSQSVKRYCSGVGLVFDSGAELVRYRRMRNRDDDDSAGRPRR